MAYVNPNDPRQQDPRVGAARPRPAPSAPQAPPRPASAGPFVAAGPGSTVTSTATNYNPAVSGGGPSARPAPPRQPVPGVGVSPIVPGADMRSSNILPAVTNRATAAGRQVTGAASQVASFDRPATLNAYDRTFTSRLAPGQVNVEGLNTPSRSDIAMQRLAAFDADEAPRVRELQRASGQRSAALGRIGSGMAAIEALQPFVDYRTRRSALATQLAADTAEGEIGDAVRERDTRLGVQERGVDRALGARRSALELATGVSGQDRAGDIATLDALRDTEGSILDTEQGYRDEFRGERDYEQLLSRAAIEDAIRQRGMENAEVQGNWARAFAEANPESNAASGYLGAAQQAGALAGSGYGGAADLFGSWLSRRRASQESQ